MDKKNEAKLVQWRFVIFLAIYALSSVAFQVLYPYFSYWPTVLTSPITLNNCYTLQARIPATVPILYASQAEQAKQFTFWVWKSDTTCADEVTVLFSSMEDMIWLNQNKNEVVPSLLMQVGEAENLAPRYSLYAHTPVRPHPNPQFDLNISLKDDPAPAQNIPLHGQTQGEALLWGFLFILFGTPSLTMVAGALATGFGIFQTYKNLETMRLQRQREIETDIEELKKVSGRDVADIGLQYSSLIDRIEKWGFGDDDVVLSTAQRAFKSKQDEHSRARIWAFNFRKEITNKLSSPEFKKWLEKANKDIQFLSPEEFKTIILFSDRGREISSFDELLSCGLSAFGILGVDNVDDLSKVIASVIPRLVKDSDQSDVDHALTLLKDRWFNSGASGRYLCGKLADMDDARSKFIEELNINLAEWKNAEDYPPNPLSANAALWTSAPIYLSDSTAEKYLKRFFFNFNNIKWHTPFGPVKAEFDPRLSRKSIKDDARPVMGFFWDEHPIWEKVIAPEPLCIVAERGMGSTTLILMGRHTRRFWGSSPSLSIFLQLHGNADEGVFWPILEQALFEQLIRDLVEDPFWLLNAPVSSQQMIASFLIRKAGDFPALLLKIDEAGLREKEQEREVVGLALFDVGESAIYQSHLQFTELLKAVTRAMLEAARPRMKDDQFHSFLWIELKESTSAEDWVSLIERCGLKSLCIIKLFAHAPMYSINVRRAIQVQQLTWERGQLRDMLVKRIKQTRQLSVDDFPLDKILDEAKGSPARLIGAGNKFGFPGE